MAGSLDEQVASVGAQPMIGRQRAEALAMLALCLFLIPALAWITTAVLMSDVDAQWRELPAEASPRGSDARPIASTDRAAWCRSNAPSRTAGTASEQAQRQACAATTEVSVIRRLSAGSAALGALLIAGIYGARSFAGADRRRMSLVFGPTVRVVVVLLCLSTLMQAGLFVYCLAIVEVLTLQGVHIGLLVAGAAGAVISCFALLRASLTALKNEPLAVLAIELTPMQQPRLFTLIDSISAKLGAVVPDHVVLGLDPVFFVSTASLRLTDGSDAVLRGHTLYLSLSLMRILSVAQVATIIGHEFGHLRGGDLAFSESFAPMYARLRRTIDALSQPAGLAAEVGRFPAVMALSLCAMEFASAERTVGRERELLADQAGVEVVDARTLGCALLKSALLAEQWGILLRCELDLTRQGQSVPRMAEAYALHCDTHLASLDWVSSRHALEDAIQPHPCDTHPRLLQRMQNLRLRMDDFDLTDLTRPDHSASHILECRDSLDEALSATRALLSTTSVRP